MMLLLAKEILEHIRTYRLVVVAGLSLLIGMGSPLAAYHAPKLIETLARQDSTVEIAFTRQPSLKDALQQYTKNFGLLTLAVILLAMAGVGREVRSGTAALVITQPVARTTFLAIKLCGLLALFGSGLVLAGAGFMLYTAELFEAPSWSQFLAANALLFLLIVLYTSLTTLGSSLFTSQAAAAAVGFGGFLLLQGWSVLPRVGCASPARLTEYALAIGMGRDAAGLVAPLVAALAIIISSSATACWHFRTREL
ncbi:MAG: ABC transporter permease subunit [Planctomycetota bacterium]